MTSPTYTDAGARRRIQDDLGSTLFVEAGAGTGKTRELIERLVRLVASGAAEQRSIAAITFTESAAAELRDRVRLRLEDAARDEALSPAERERCAAAITQLDGAAIETLHAFAQRILSEHAVEAGLPPVIDVQEEIRASIAFEERWNAYVDELLADPSMEETLLRAFTLGLALKDLRDVALQLHENWDRLEDPSIPETPLPPVDVSLVLARLDQALELRGHRANEEDKLFRHLEDTLVPYRSRLAAAGSELDRLRVLADGRRLNPGRIGNKKNWDVIAPDDIRELLSDAQSRRNATINGARAAVLTSLLSSLRAFTLTYAQERKRSGRLEFHDLLVQARDLLRQNSDVRRDVRERYTHLLIDEFQDTDPLQIEIATLIAGEDEAVTPGRLFFVGDPKQSVYRFRRADIELYQRAQERFAAGLVHLTQNFRAVQPVIDWTNHIFSRLIDPAQPGQAAYVPLEASRPPPAAGVTVRVLGGPSEDTMDPIRRREAKELAQVIRSAKAAPWQIEVDGTLTNASYRDIAVLIPTRTALPPIEEALEDAGIPYRVESRSLVYGTQEVRDLLSVLRAIDDPTDEVALIAALRSPAFACADDDLLRYRQAGGHWDYRREPSAGGPVAAALASLRSFHERRWWMPISGLVETVIRERRLFELAFAHRRPRERWQRLRFALDQARAFAEAGGRTLRQFIEWAERQAIEGTRVIETVVPEPDDDAVRIMTIHAAKGLEFPIVVLAGLNIAASHKPSRVLWGEDGAIEASLGDDSASFVTNGYEQLKQREKEMDQAEKVRLIYVAATRARDHLIVSLHHKRDQECHASAIHQLCMEARELWRPAEAAQIAAPAQHAPSTAFDDSAERRDRWQRERSQRIAALSRVPAIAATEVARRAAHAEDDPNLQKERPPADAPPWKRGRAGTAFGRAVHAVLQTIDLDRGGDVEGAARAQAAAEGIPARAGEIARAALAAIGTPCLRDAVASRHWRELYVAAPIEGVTLEGFIDLLYETPDGLVVVDYKTDVVPDAARLDEMLQHYRLQGAAYALALQEALGRPVARCVFVFTQASGAQEKELPELAGAIAEVREVLRQPPAGELGAAQLGDGERPALRPLDELDDDRVGQIRLL
jgi:ATP-dependent helicase/nuclease subunit A